MSQQTRLIQTKGAASGREIPLSVAVVLGRSEEADFVVEDNRASRRHLELRLDQDAWVVVDLNSSNGTFLNGAKLAAEVPVRLENGVLLSIGDAEFLFADGQATQNPPTQSVALLPTFTIGRAPGCDLVIDSPNISRQHCRMTKTARGWTVEDLSSQNGTYLNGVRVLMPEALRQGDEVALDLHRFVFRDGALEYMDQSSTVRLDVQELEHIVQHDGKPLPLLQSVNVVIPPKEFVAIVGGSGAGKSTLLNAIAGLHPASGGTVRLNGIDLYTHPELFRPVIGYVPQEDVVHKELRVEAALGYAAELRLPPDTDAAERDRLVEAALAELELSHRRNSFVSTLSGGERKRVSVAMELLSHPGLLFLDEPTSGLDPGLELKFLELVTRLAREGRTIVMVTHSASIMLACDKLLFMARGGRVAFYGPPQDALAFFEVEHIAQAYVRVDTEQRPDHWEQKYLRSDYCRRYVTQPLANAPERRKGETQVVAGSLGATQPRLKASGQFSLLLRRYADTMRGDLQNLGLLLAQAPVIALILLAVFPANLFDPSRFTTAFVPGDTTPASLLFCMVISALLFGVINAAREITKESAIYQRERMVNLRPGPYLLSKVVLLSALCVLQSVLLVGILRLKIDFHLEAGGYLAMTGILMLMTLCGSLLGLMLSGFAVATTKASDRTNLVAKANDRAMTLVPLVVLPQIVFSGMMELESLGNIGKIMPSYWAYAALGNLTQLNATMYRLLRQPKEQFNILPGSAALALCGIGVVYTLCAYGFLARKK